MHRILTQTLEISTSTEAAALEVQRALSRAFEGAQRHRIERVFDRLAGPDTLRIDRLELDLGVVTGADWLDRLFDRLADATLRAVAAEGPAAPHDAAAPGAASAGTAARATGVTRSDARRSALDALAEYLLTGRLPWWSDLAPAPHWLAAALADLTPAGRSAIAALAGRHPRALHRLVLALSPDALARLLGSRIPALDAGCLAALAELLAASPAPRNTPAAGSLEFWTACLAASEGAPAGAADRAAALRSALAQLLAERRSRGTLPDAVVRAVLTQLPRDWRAPFRRACDAAGMPLGRSVAPAGQAGASAGRPPPPAPSAGLHPGRPPATAAGADPAASPAAPARAAAGPAPQAGPRPDTGAPVPVAAAGLVLFHPFFPELFTRCGWWDGKAFPDPAAPHAAARLLGHIAYGTLETDEATLTLAKILSGIDPPESVLEPAPPDEAALARADALIGAVLGHWSALRSRDPAFLRSQFLQRRGHLWHTDTGWELRVEGLAQDVLLDRLPWGIGVIRLPWMRPLLTVRWRD